MEIRGIKDGERYIHFKRKTDYTVVGFSKATDEEGTLNVLYVETEKLFDYIAGEVLPWSRDITEFAGTKEVDGKLVKRFEKVESV